MCESVKVPGWQSGQMRWPRESLSLLGRSGSNPDPGVRFVLALYFSRT